VSNLLRIIGSPFFFEAFGLCTSLFALVVLLTKGLRRGSPGMILAMGGLLCLAASFGMGLAAEVSEWSLAGILSPRNPVHSVLKTALRFHFGFTLFLAGALAGLTNSRRAPFGSRPRGRPEQRPVEEEDELAGHLAVANRDLVAARTELRRIAGENSRVSEQLKETMDLLLRSEERFRTVFERTNDGIALVDPKSRCVTLANPGLTALTGRTAKDLQSMTLVDLLGTDVGNRDEAGFRELSMLGRLPPMTILRKGGEPLRVEVTVSLIDVSGGRAVLCVVRDVSEWQRLKDALEAKNRALQEQEANLREANRRLSERAETVRGMNEKLTELQRVKDDFLSSVSHELRTPLTSIRSFSEILLENGDAEEEVKREFLAIIKKESERLTRLINDVLDLAKIEAGAVKLRMGRVDLNAVFADVVRLLAPLARERDLIVERRIDPELPRVEGDRDKLQQVLTNLGSNAIRHGRPGTRVVLAAERKADGEILVGVHDRGPGIPPEELDGIFDRFHQTGDAKEERDGGTGLGLAICREIVALHGGRIWAESRAGFGSSFFFTVKEGEAAASRSEPVASDLRFPVRRELRGELPPLVAVSGAQSRLPPPAW
jgi:PAS domain S-box-containing protein